jgi:hypothetical protein
MRLAKMLSEAARIDKAALLRDLAGGESRLLQQPHRRQHACLEQKLLRSDAKRALKPPLKLPQRLPARFGHVFDQKRL